MYRSSAYSVKHRLEAQLKAQQLIVEACDEAIKRVHPEDPVVRACHVNEREIARASICKIMALLDANRLEIVRGLE